VRTKPKTTIVLTAVQHNNILRRERHASPVGLRRAFVDKHFNYYRFAKSLNLKKLTAREVLTLRDMLSDFADITRLKTTKRSIWRKVAVIDLFLARSAVDRLGDVV
jgi:hypothetical protein